MKSARILLLSILAISCAIVPARAAVPIRLPVPQVQSYRSASIVLAADATARLSGAQIFIRAGLDRQTSAQNGLAALVAQSILLTPVRPSNLGLRDAVAAQGGSVDFVIDGGFVRFYLEGIAGAFERALVPLFATALAHPNFEPVMLAQARAELDAKIADDQKIPLTVGLEMLNASFFTGSNAGLPPYGLPGTLAQQSGTDAARFYAANYRSGGAVVSAVGAFANGGSQSLRSIVDALAPGSSDPVPVRIPALRGSARRLVTHRDIAVPWVVAQFPAPPLTSPDFGAMLVLASFLERTTQDVAANPTITSARFAERAVGSFYNFDERPASVVLYINGGLGDPTRPLSTALSVMQIFANSKLAGDIGKMKTIAAGSYLEGASSLEDRAWLAGVFVSQGLTPDYAAHALQAIADVRAADLQRVARGYLANPTLAVVLPRDTNASQN